MAGGEECGPRRGARNLPWLSSGSTGGTAGCHRETFGLSALRSRLLVTFPQSGIWEMKHLPLGVKAGLIYFGEKGEGGRVTWEENVLPVPRNQRGIVHL